MTQQRTDWFFEARWGVFMHFLGPVVDARGNELSAGEWNQLVDGFDVEGLARQLQEVQAPYFILTLGQNSGHYCAPNATYDRLTGITPSKCSRRDLVADLYAALAPRGIRLMVYIPSGAPKDDPVACEKLEWAFRGGDRFINFQCKWEAVIREWSLRWGQKVCGWWMDGCYWIDDMYRHPAPPNFKSFAAALRAGNPDRILAWNPGVLYPPITVDQEEDYTAGEINEPEQVDSPGRRVKQAQFHILSYLGQTWAKGPIRFSDAQAIEYTRRLTDYGGVVTWDVLPLRNGLIAEPFFRQLKTISAAILASRSLPIQPPPRRLRLTVTFPVSPIVGADGRRTPGAMCLNLANSWDSAVCGHVQIEVEPAGAVKFSRSEVSACLPAESNACEDIQIDVAASVHPEAAITVRLQSEGDSRIIRQRLPVHRELLLSVLPPLQGLGELAARLAAVPVQTVMRDGQSLGNFRLAIAGDMLAILARINDRSIKQTLAGYDGSCVEVYLAPIESQAIRQFILVPATQQAVSRALENVTCGKVVPAIQPASEIRMETVSDEAGYDLRALIPLPWALKQAAGPPQFLFELAVHARMQPGADFCYGNLYASQAATNSTAFYALARLASTVPGSGVKHPAA